LSAIWNLPVESEYPRTRLLPTMPRLIHGEIFSRNQSPFACEALFYPKVGFSNPSPFVRPHFANEWVAFWMLD